MQTSKENPRTSRVELPADKLQAIHRLGALLALEETDYVLGLCRAVELRARYQRISRAQVRSIPELLRGGSEDG